MAYFYENLASFGSAPALISGDATLSYESLDARSRQIASEIGSTPRLVFLEATNTIEAICTYVGCLVGGHCVFLFSPQDASKIAGFADLYRPNRFFVSDGMQLSLRSSHDDAISLHPDLRVLLATSGSTGSPKLVKLSARNIDSNAAAIVEYLRLSASERALLSLKFNYSYGMSVVNSHLACGASVVLTDASVLDDEHWRLFTEMNATSFAGVPYTFETLFRSGDSRFETPSLRYITQAGGRLSEELVRHFANRAEASGWRFYVMYGQTEASPRISYLPPDKALRYPNCIGVAIPRGRIFLLDTNGQEVEAVDVAGELAYAGPNVMMGYATTAEQLAEDATPRFLLTGDIACRNEANLFYITGRSSRFVKPFGIRVSLDDFEARVRAQAPQAVCAGADERVVVAVLTEEAQPDLTAAVRNIAMSYGLPASAVQVLILDEIPRLANGKPDYPRISGLARTATEPIVAPMPLAQRLMQAISIVGSREFFQEVARELWHMIGLGRAPNGIAEIYASLLPNKPITPQSSFTSLAGDSLSYVQASLAIEEYLGDLPANWEQMTIWELEQRRAAMANE